MEGEGAYLLDEKLQVSDESDSSKSLISTGFPYNRFDLIDNFLVLLKNLMQKTHGIRRPGAASYDLCCVAAGRVEGFFEYGLSPWDTAAASLIIKEAGGVVSDWNGGVDWLFGKRIIAGNKAISSFLKDEIQDVFTSSELTE